MGRLRFDLVSDRKSADLELDVFTRLLTGQVSDGEEVRKDWEGNFEYVGLAEAGTNPEAPVWNCVKCTWVNGRRVRFQFKSNMSWTNRTMGWLE